MEFTQPPNSQFLKVSAGGRLKSTKEEEKGGLRGDTERQETKNEEGLRRCERKK